MKHLVKAICDFGSPWFKCNCMTVIDEKEVAEPDSRSLPLADSGSVPLAATGERAR